MSRPKFRRGARPIRGPAMLCVAAMLVATMGPSCGNNVTKRGRFIGSQGFVTVTADGTLGNPNGPTMPVTITPHIDVTGEQGGHQVTIWIDADGDGNVDVDEDTNGNGILDPGEDVDGDGKLDTAEPVRQETSSPPPSTTGPVVPPGTGGIDEPLDAPTVPKGKSVTIKIRVDVDVVEPGGDVPRPQGPIVGEIKITRQ